jgi:hypothetical protein
MHKDRRLKSFVFFSGSGCLVPALIIFNLLFGWIFLTPRQWLITEGVLVLFFVINGFIATRKISSVYPRHEDVIEVEGKVVDDKHESGSS